MEQVGNSKVAFFNPWKMSKMRIEHPKMCHFDRGFVFCRV